MKQAAVVEAMFVYNTAMREAMLPRRPLPHSELYEQELKPLPKAMPGSRAGEEVRAAWKAAQQWSRTR